MDAQVVIYRNYADGTPRAFEEMDQNTWLDFQNDVRLALDFTLGQEDSWLETHIGTTPQLGIETARITLTNCDPGYGSENTEVFGKEIKRLVKEYGQRHIEVAWLASSMVGA